MSQSDRSRPLNIWIQSDLGALATLARGAVATGPPPLVPPMLAPAHAAATATVQVAAKRLARREREKKEVIVVSAPTRASGAGTDSSPRCWPASRPDTVRRCR